MVIEKGTQNGASTDIDGKYTLKVKGTPTIEVSIIGYNTVTSALAGNQTKADFVLEEEAIKLDDVVVIGYGVQNKRDVTTAVSSIKAEDFANTPTTDFQVLNLGGQPDGNVTVRVRGIQSATSGNDPLYVIDGIPCDSRAFANLDGNDIESLEVLKDASAAAIYGSRGSCGVIIVTTKRGSGEKPVISYDGQFSVSDVSKKIDMLDAYEFAEMFRDARNGSYLFSDPTGSISDPSAGRPQVYHRIDPLINAYLEDKTGTLTNTDWQDEELQLLYRSQLSLSRGYCNRLGFREIRHPRQHGRKERQPQIRLKLLSFLFQDQLRGHGLPVWRRRCHSIRIDGAACLPCLQLRRHL